MLPRPGMASGVGFLDMLTAGLQLGMLVQWQQAHDAGLSALELALRKDLLEAGLDTLSLSRAALDQLNLLAHMDGFCGAVLCPAKCPEGVWGPARPRGRNHAGLPDLSLGDGKAGEGRLGGRGCVAQEMI